MQTIIGDHDELCNIDPKNIDLFTLKDKYYAKVIDCYDGDTITCILKLDTKFYKFKVRLDGYDAPEMKPSKTISAEVRDKIKIAACAVKKQLEELVLNKVIVLHCNGFDKYGRILGVLKLTDNDTQTINDIMIKNSNNYEYHGGTKKQIF